MSEANNNPLNAQEELMRRLKSIGIDLWGSGPEPAQKKAAEEAVENDFAAVGRENQPGEGEGKLPAGEKTPVAAPGKQLTLENLWITADETVDWTEALLRETPRDGLTGQKAWSFYHRMAPDVLAGRTEAYAEVLTTMNPLGDLTPYVSGMILRTPGPDRLECVFECQRQDLEERGRDYLGALSLRIARDLLAILPVEEVGITGNLDGKEKVRVTFRRGQLLKQKMAFLRPADFLEACGGSMTLETEGD